MRRPWLLPFVPLYAVGLKLVDIFTKSAGCLMNPVISIGNLSTGGTGKTPFTIALAKLLKSEGFNVDVLSRGYGRSSLSVEEVDPDGDAARFGDEPILIAQQAEVPVYVGKSRLLAGQFAEGQSAANSRSLHLLDDGFQHRALNRQVDIVLIDSQDLADSLLPAGNLREPVSALRRASAFAIAVDDDQAVETLLLGGFGPQFSQPIWRFRREVSIPWELAGAPAVAFCGIARPEQFFTGLVRNGVQLNARHAFKDHHRFQPKDLTLLKDLAQRSGAKAFVTTAKDYVRLGNLKVQLTAIAPLHVADLKIQIEDPSALTEWLNSASLPSRTLHDSDSFHQHHSRHPDWAYKAIFGCEKIRPCGNRSSTGY